jgi:hypothetical protein
VRAKVVALLGLMTLCSACDSPKDQIVQAWSDAKEAAFFGTDPIFIDVVSASGRRLQRAEHELERLNGIAMKYYPESEPILMSPDAIGCPYPLPAVGTQAYLETAKAADFTAAHIDRLNARFAAELKKVDLWPNSWINGKHASPPEPPAVVRTVA